MSAPQTSIIPNHSGAQVALRGIMSAKLSGPMRCVTTDRAINHNAFSKGDRSVMADLILLSDWQKSQYEFWMPAPGVPHYDVSSFGRIRTYWGKKRGKAWKDAFTHFVSNTPTKILNPKPNKTHGYVEVYLRLNGRGKNIRAHRLIAAAFLPNAEGLPEVNHKTGLKTDNRVDNLEWSTRTANQQHAARVGLGARGEGHALAKLTEPIVREMRALAAEGMTIVKIAERYGLSDSQVGRVVNRSAWRHVG